MKMTKKRWSIPLITVMIWGSLYVASRQVLQYMPALVLLAFRFVIASVILLGAARIRKLEMIGREDQKELLLIGFLGYFLSNGALLLGVQYAGSSFSSLINALTPVFISVFAVILLGEKLTRLELISLVIAVSGTFVIIGTPGKELTPFGIFCCLFSTIVWSYTTIHVKKLTAKYDPIVVTGSAMALAAMLAIPAALLYLKISKETITIGIPQLGSLAYVCIICTAVSHLMWNKAMKKNSATYCARFYPIQPLTSVVLGVLIFHERVSIPFLVGTSLILISILLPQLKGYFHPVRFPTRQSTDFLPGSVTADTPETGQRRR